MSTVLGPATDLGALVRRLRGQGAVHVVPAGVDKAETLARFGEALHFPDWYGLNYDALFDCLLQHVHDAAGGAPVHLVWDGVTALREAHPEVYEMVRRILGDAEDEKPRLRVTVVDR
ncbi:barstar family protein [Phycicoccus sonneratiae]|uniref:Barstar family protein n=1 Tax=Phycicoccus sonneratiae TaxID=2807628 RepID=A0ABS2CRN3_9MICO|nr:barstar family protein [Phycicoccus sonneraticus]MBM6402539.1 barstar family protein [Phycicoccus sonneraticus]